MNQSRMVNAGKRSLAPRFIASCLSASLLVLVLVIGCGNENPSPEQSTSPTVVQACDLLTVAEVEAVIGGSIEKPRKTHNDGDSTKQWMSMCNYYSEEKQISMGVTIIPHGRSVTGQEAFALYETDLRQSLGQDFKFRIIDDIGDYAGWDASTKQLTIFKGPFMIVVGLISPKVKGTAALDLNRRLAETFLAKL